MEIGSWQGPGIPGQRIKCSHLPGIVIGAGKQTMVEEKVEEDGAAGKEGWIVDKGEDEEEEEEEEEEEGAEEEKEEKEVGQEVRELMRREEESEGMSGLTEEGGEAEVVSEGQSVSSKSVADLAEALIGCYWREGGYEVACQVMRWMGVPLCPTQPIGVGRGMEPTSPSQSSVASLVELEGRIGYSFRRRGWLEHAMTHASYTGLIEGGECYQVRGGSFSYRISRFAFRVSNFTSLSKCL